MRRLPVLVALFVAGFGVFLAAEPQRRTTPARSRISTAFACVAPLGEGVKSRRSFCDVFVGAKPEDSVSIAIPAHTGPATLLFDLHNRFSLPPAAGPVALAFARHEALVAVVRPTGESVGLAAVVREFRTTADLFDQIGGGSRPGGVKAVAPGAAESVRLPVPAGVNAVGIVGVRLKVTHAGGSETFDAPGRPVAMVSNVRVDYTPAR